MLFVMHLVMAGVTAPSHISAAVDAAASRTDRVHELRADVRSFGGTAIAADTVERLCV